MTVRRVAIPLAALPLALILGCERQPGLQIATDRAVRDAGADSGSDRGAPRADASGGERSGPDAAGRDAGRPDAPTVARSADGIG